MATKKKEAFDYEEIDDALKRCKRPKSGTNIITPLARFSFPNLQKPRANKKTDDPDKKKKYGVSLLIPPGFSLKLLRADVERAREEKWGDKTPSKMKQPFLEAGDFEYEGYQKGWTLIRATCLQKPGVIDALEGVKITDEDDPAIYPGRWGVATIRAFAYEVDGNKGIAFGLNNVKLLFHDESLGGRTRAEDEFDIDDDYGDMKSGKKKAFEEDEDEDDRPRKSSKRKAIEDDEDDEPRRPAKKRRPADDDDEDEAPVRKKRRVVEEDEDDEPPVRKKRRVVEDDEDDEPPVRKKRRVVEDDDEDEAPRPKKRRSRDDDDDDLD